MICSAILTFGLAGYDLYIFSYSRLPTFLLFLLFFLTMGVAFLFSPKYPHRQFLVSLMIISFVSIFVSFYFFIETLRYGIENYFFAIWFTAFLLGFIGSLIKYTETTC